MTGFCFLICFGRYVAIKKILEQSANQELKIGQGHTYVRGGDHKSGQLSRGYVGGRREVALSSPSQLSSYSPSGDEMGVYGHGEAHQNDYIRSHSTSTLTGGRNRSGLITAASPPVSPSHGGTKKTLLKTLF